MVAHTAHSFLSAATSLQTLLQQAQKLLALQETWNEVAPKPLAAASRVGAISQQILVIYTSNGAVAAKLKQIAPTLLAKLQARGVEVTAIRIDVQVTSPVPSKKPKDLSVSRNALSSLNKLEESLADSPLKSALQSLIQRHSDSTEG